MATRGSESSLSANSAHHANHHIRLDGIEGERFSSYCEYINRCKKIALHTAQLAEKELLSPEKPQAIALIFGTISVDVHSRYRLFGSKASAPITHHTIGLVGYSFQEQSRLPSVNPPRPSVSSTEVIVEYVASYLNECITIADQLSRVAPSPEIGQIWSRAIQSAIFDLRSRVKHHTSNHCLRLAGALHTVDIMATRTCSLGILADERTSNEDKQDDTCDFELHDENFSRASQEIRKN